MSNETNKKHKKSVRKEHKQAKKGTNGLLHY